MLLSEILSAIGLALDIVGFLILFALAIPALMRRNFVASDRVSLDGVGVDPGHVERSLMDPKGAKLLEQRRRQRQTWCYWAGGSAVLVGFALQFVALFVP